MDAFDQPPICRVTPWIVIMFPQLENTAVQEVSGIDLKRLIIKFDFDTAKLNGLQ